MGTARRIALVGVLALAWGLVPSESARAHPGIDEQIADVTARIEQDPGDASLYLRRGELHRIHRDWKLAQADYEKARALDESLAVVDLALGKMQLEASDPAAALKTLDGFLAKRPGSVDGLIGRARAHRDLGHYLSAARDYTAALANIGEGRPRPEYYLERARVLDAAGIEHAAEAIAGLDEGLAILGQPVTLQLLAVDLELKLERWDSALARIDTLAGQSARKETWLVRRGEILEAAERPDQAREAYRETLAAIGSLPPSRRRNRAVERLAEQARTSLERLEPTAAAVVEE
jgi:tetratricopeptide (TPR) repeat protein